MENITRWDIVLVIITLFGFIVALFKCVLPLIKQLTRLTDAVDHLEKHCTKAENDNEEEHKEFRGELKAHDELLSKHDGILTAITSHTQ